MDAFVAVACVGDAGRRVAWKDGAGDDGSCGVVACMVGAGVDNAFVDCVGVDKACGVLAWTAPALRELIYIIFFEVYVFREESSCDLGGTIGKRMVWASSSAYSLEV